VPRGAPLSARASGAWLIAAAALFWLAWALMPGVGVTAAASILERVGASPGSVLASVALQLASAACYAPALVGVAGLEALRRRRAVRWGAALLLVGAMGSAADAVFHLLAVEMVRPDVDRAAMLPVMARMQGPGLLLVAPLIAAFFAGSFLLALGFARGRVVSRRDPWLFAVALAVAVAGSGAAGSSGAARAVGLSFLALVSLSQVRLGLGLARGAVPEAAR
jgi:hypothetical protein